MKLLFLFALLLFLSAPAYAWLTIKYQEVPACDMWCQIPDVRPGLKPCCEEQGFQIGECKNEFQAICGKVDNSWG